MSEERWDVPSEKLRAIAEIPEPELRPMTKAEKDRIVGPTVVARETGMFVEDRR